MAEIWITHSELANLCSCGIHQARAFVEARRWSQKTTRSGATMVLLPDDLAFDYMTRLGSTTHTTETSLDVFLSGETTSARAA